MLAIQPMQWGRLQDLHDVPDIDQTDAACMEEIRAVLARQASCSHSHSIWPDVTP